MINSFLISPTCLLYAAHACAEPLQYKAESQRVRFVTTSTRNIGHKSATVKIYFKSAAALQSNLAVIAKELRLIGSIEISI
jgi:hypothetical protein